VQDLDRGALWSAGIQPTAVQPEYQEVYFHPHMAEFRRRDHDISLTMKITVAPGEDVEIRHISITNDSSRQRHLRLTSFSEVVLTSQEADTRHLAFNKLFVESEYLPAQNALLYRRRPRSADEKPIYLAHMLVIGLDRNMTGAHESDRARFFGRGNTARQPTALTDEEWLTSTTGATLDPAMALGQDLVLTPHETVHMAFVTIAAGTHQEVLNLLGRYRAMTTVNHTFIQAQTQAEKELRKFSLTSLELERFQQLLSLLHYPHRVLRADKATLAANQSGQTVLWPFGISGDYPILLLHIHDESQGALLHDLLQAHRYWRRHGLNIDLIIINLQETSYGQPLYGYIRRLVKSMGGEQWLNRHGGIFILRRDQMTEAAYILLQTAARVVLDGTKGSLANQLAALLWQPTPLPPLLPVVDASRIAETTLPLSRPEGLLFDNGLGGFTDDGREYLIYLRPGETTPAPWINVIANPNFGFLVSEAGSGCAWAGNSGENRLATWRNDPVSDMPAEALYLRDEETAEVWSPTPQPCPAKAPYLVRHGTGYSIFEHNSHGLIQQLRLFVVPDAPVKVMQLHLENVWEHPRRITVTFYAEWVLGADRETNQQFIVPEYDHESHALLARNPYNVEFGKQVAFIAPSKEPHGLTTDRTEFLGRLGSLSQPAGLTRIGLEGRVDAGLDCCAAIQLHIDLPPRSEETVYFLVGQGSDRDEALRLAKEFQKPYRVAEAWLAAQQQWEEILSVVTVDTPDAAMNLLLNRWLLYQTLSCRIWGRSALYQSSGAYGFRDQLQDVMALVHTKPQLAREHIVRAARHQFEEGDVLHWWHPPSGRGVRTRISDDLLWLPYVTSHYITTTGDETILDEKIPFLTGKLLEAEEEERYGFYETTTESFNLFEHNRRAIQKGMTVGQHGLPLIGGGDWNDGMNRIGIEGKGESIWLGWFLYTVLVRFADLCQRIGKDKQAADYRRQAEVLRQALEKHGWDGSWYRRAYYDDATPLGSSQNRECQIDAIAQSWGVLSGAADPERGKQAMQEVLERLVKWDERLILLFAPPFDETIKDPGYIKGYLPGIRENGGQYTHAALWTIWAFAELGQGDLAESLFRLINPIYRADTHEKAIRYKVEPYVISADVYDSKQHTGRGGWTWYTGSSSWMYRLGIEGILGLHRTGMGLSVSPCIPKKWKGYNLTYRHHQTTYMIQVENPDGVCRGVKQVLLDGHPLENGLIPWLEDGCEHQVVVRLGREG
jgi:cyclic beta-1,2-glucan synthetase